MTNADAVKAPENNTNNQEKETETSTLNQSAANTKQQNGAKKRSFLGYTDDGRYQFQWQSVYPHDARRAMRNEAIYIGIFFVIACVILILNYFRTFNGIFGIAPGRVSFPYYIYLIGSGLLGGVIFEMKVLCTVAAKGYWHKDRFFWRLMSPMVSAGMAYIIGAMASAGLLASENSSSNAWAIAIGFFAGYFADEAAGKMKEVAMVFFGKTAAGEQTSNASRVEEIINCHANAGSNHGTARGH
jgi:hypothetical protein